MSPELCFNRAPTARRLSAFAGAAILAVMLPASPIRAQEQVDAAAIERIKAEGLGDRSEVMETASWLTDVFGAPSHRFAEHQGRSGVVSEEDDGMGDGERQTGAVGHVRPWLDQ